MLLHSTLSAEDYVDNLLFFNSINERLIKRRRNDMILSACFAMVPVILAILLENWIFTLTFLIIAIVGLYTQPKRKKNTIRRHYRRHVEENFHNRFGKEAIVTIDSKEIYVATPGEEGRIDFDQMETIYEVPYHFFIKLLSGTSLIIPKDRVADAAAVGAELHAIAAQYNREYVVMNGWKW